MNHPQPLSYGADDTVFAGTVSQPVSSLAIDAFKNIWGNALHRPDDGSRALIRAALETLLRARKADDTNLCGRKLPEMSTQMAARLNHMCKALDSALTHQQDAETALQIVEHYF